MQTRNLTGFLSSERPDNWHAGGIAGQVSNAELTPAPSPYASEKDLPWRFVAGWRVRGTRRLQRKGLMRHDNSRTVTA